MAKAGPEVGQDAFPAGDPGLIRRPEPRPRASITQPGKVAGGPGPADSHRCHDSNGHRPPGLVPRRASGVRPERDSGHEPHRPGRNGRIVVAGLAALTGCSSSPAPAAARPAATSVTATAAAARFRPPPPPPRAQPQPPRRPRPLPVPRRPPPGPASPSPRRPVPTLGHPAGVFAHGAASELVRPSRIFNGGDRPAWSPMSPGPPGAAPAPPDRHQRVRGTRPVRGRGPRGGRHGGRLRPGDVRRQADVPGRGVVLPATAIVPAGGTRTSAPAATSRPARARQAAPPGGRRTRCAAVGHHGAGAAIRVRGPRADGQPIGLDRPHRHPDRRRARRGRGIHLVRGRAAGRLRADRDPGAARTCRTARCCTAAPTR